MLPNHINEAVSLINDSTQLYQVHSSGRQANSILIIGILSWSQNSLLLDAFLSKVLKKMK